MQAEGARLGIGLAAVGRPAYLTSGRAADLGSRRDVADLRRRTEEVLDAAYAAGVRYVDVARSYGRAEEFLAGWLAAHPETGDVLVGSKWGYRYVGGWRIDADVHEVKDHSLAALTEQLAETAALLGPRLAVHHVHSATLDTGVLDDAAVHRALAGLRERGVRIGVSTSGPAQAEVVRRALDVEVDGTPLFTSVQSTWNVLEPSAGPALTEAAARGARVIVKEAVANGRLAPGGATPPGCPPGSRPGSASRSTSSPSGPRWPGRGRGVCSPAGRARPRWRATPPRAASTCPPRCRRNSTRSPRTPQATGRPGPHAPGAEPARYGRGVDLSPGQNAPLTGGTLTVTVTGPVDLTALVLGGDGTVSGDADMVFFNQPAAPGVALAGRRLDVRLDELRPGADQVALIASPEQEDARFGQLPEVAITVDHGGEALVFRPANLDSETALVLCSVYRRAGTWKLRAVGQGYATGLAGVATDYGIEVEDAPAPAAPAAPPPPPAPAPALDMLKKPTGAINLAKSGSALIPMTKGDAGTLRVRASLRWSGRERGGTSDLDFYALHVDASGSEGAVYYKDKGTVSAPPWIALDGDSRGAGEENLTIVAGKHPYVLLCAYSAVGNGIGSFTSYNAHVVVDDGQGSAITVPLLRTNKFSYWVAIALVDATDPAGLRVSQVEKYGKSFSEKRPVLRGDGTFQMSKGKVEFKRP